MRSHRRTPGRRLTTTLALTAAAVLTLASCTAGTEPAAHTTTSTPAQEVAAAFGALDDHPTLAVTVAAHVPDAALAEMAAEAGTTVQQLSDVAGGTLTFTTSTIDGQPLAAHTGTPTDPDADPVVDVALDVSSATGTLVDLRAVNGNLYLALGGDLAAAVQAAGAGTVPPQWRADAAPVLAALGNGAPVTISADTLADTQGALESLDPQSGAPDLDAAQTAQLTAALSAALADATDVREVTDGTAYTATLRVRPFVADVLAAVTPHLPQQQNPMLPDPAELAREIPADLTAEFDITVADGAATGVSVDLGQFLSPVQKAKLLATGDDLRLDVTFDTAAPKVTAPADAVSADPLVTAVLTLFAATAPPS